MAAYVCYRSCCRQIFSFQHFSRFVNVLGEKQERSGHVLTTNACFRLKVCSVTALIKLCQEFDTVMKVKPVTLSSKVAPEQVVQVYAGPCLYAVKAFLNTEYLSNIGSSLHCTEEEEPDQDLPRLFATNLVPQYPPPPQFFLQDTVISVKYCVLKHLVSGCGGRQYF